MDSLNSSFHTVPDVIFSYPHRLGLDGMKMQVRAVELRLPLSLSPSLLIYYDSEVPVRHGGTCCSTITQLVKAERLSVDHTVLYSKTLFLN